MLIEDEDETDRYWREDLAKFRRLLGLERKVPSGRGYKQRAAGIY